MGVGALQTSTAGGEAASVDGELAVAAITRMGGAATVAANADAEAALRSRERRSGWRGGRAAAHARRRRGRANAADKGVCEEREAWGEK